MEPSGTQNYQPNKVKGVADICFLIDVTGSMQPCIDDIKNNIQAFIDSLTTEDANGGTVLKEWRASVCGYRDFVFEPKNGKEHMVMNPFVSDAQSLKNQLSALKAEGGGEEPESLLDALYVVINRGKTGVGEDLNAEKWRYSSEAARCVIVFTDASFHETMSALSGAEGGTVQDIINLVQQERIWLFIFAPEMECHYKLAAADKSYYDAIPVPDETVKNARVKALREYTSDKENFCKVLDVLAKSVSRSGAVDIL